MFFVFLSNELKSKLMHRNSREIRSAETDPPYTHNNQYEQDKSNNEYVDDKSSQRVQPEPEMHDMSNMLTSLPEHSNMN